MPFPLLRAHLIHKTISIRCPLLLVFTGVLWEPGTGVWMTIPQRREVRRIVGTAGGTPVLAAGGHREAKDPRVTGWFGRWFGGGLCRVMKRPVIAGVVRMDDDTPAAGGPTDSWHSGR